MVKFAYAVGQIRSIEALMLTSSHLLRMADAKDFSSSFFVLSETSYAKKIDLLSKSFDFAELLGMEYAFVKKLLTDLSGPSPILSALWKKHEDPSLPENEYMKLLSNVLSDNPNRLFENYVNSFISLYQKKATAHGSQHIIEKEIDNKLLEIIKSAKFKSFGIEPLIGFWVGKEMEMKNIKLILNAKLLGIETDEIKQRMRDSYV